MPDWPSSSFYPAVWFSNQDYLNMYSILTESSLWAMRPGPMVSPETCGWMTQRNCAQICRWHEYASLMAKLTWPCTRRCCTVKPALWIVFTSCEVMILFFPFFLATERQVWRWSRWCLASLWLREPALMKPTWIWLLLSSNGWKIWTIRKSKLICWKRRTFRDSPRTHLGARQPQKMLLLIEVFQNQTCDSSLALIGFCVADCELLIFLLVLLCLEEQRAQGLQRWLATLALPGGGLQSSAELQLAVGALIVEEMRAAVEKHTGFQCSAGISHNKVGVSIILFFQLQHSVTPNCEISCCCRQQMHQRIVKVKYFNW